MTKLTVSHKLPDGSELVVVVEVDGNSETSLLGIINDTIYKVVAFDGGQQAE